MAGHCSEPGIDLPRLPRPDLVDSGPHVVEDAALRHTAQHPECLRQRVEQHLMGLKQIGSHDEGATMREFGMSDLQFRHFAVQHGIILAPVELEGLARLESQRNERPASDSLLFILKLGHRSHRNPAPPDPRRVAWRSASACGISWIPPAAKPTACPRRDRVCWGAPEP